MMKNSAKRIAFWGLSLAIVLAGFTGIAQAVPTVAYDFEITTHYDGGDCDINGICGSPDTGLTTIRNAGTSDFTGTLGVQATTGCCFIGSSTSTDLAAGASKTFAINNESSNFGGYNDGAGVEVFLSGSVSFGVDTELVALSVFDMDIHSGVVRDAFGDFPTDAYVIEGGDSTRDTGDGFEESQADGHFAFVQRLPDGAVPEPGTILLLGSGLAGLAVWRRKKN